MVAAEATDQLRVGTLVLNNDFRHPVVLAREAATVDLLTDGRLELGLGAGHMKYEYDQVGLSFDPPAVRVARMTEAAEIIRRLLAGEEVTFAGEHYQVDRHRCFPLPTQLHVPLLIGGNGRRLLATAARLADIVSFTGFSQVEGERNVNPTHFTVEGLHADRIPVVAIATSVRSEVGESVDASRVSCCRAIRSEGAVRPIVRQLGSIDAQLAVLANGGGALCEGVAVRRRAGGVSLCDPDHLPFFHPAGTAITPFGSRSRSRCSADSTPNTFRGYAGWRRHP